MRSFLLHPALVALCIAVPYLRSEDFAEYICGGLWPLAWSPTGLGSRIRRKDFVGLQYHLGRLRLHLQGPGNGWGLYGRVRAAKFLFGVSRLMRVFEFIDLKLDGRNPAPRREPCPDATGESGAKTIRTLVTHFLLGDGRLSPPYWFGGRLLSDALNIPDGLCCAKRWRMSCDSSYFPSLSTAPCFLVTNALFLPNIADMLLAGETGLVSMSSLVQLISRPDAAVCFATRRQYVAD